MSFSMMYITPQNIDGKDLRTGQITTRSSQAPTKILLQSMLFETMQISKKAAAWKNNFHIPNEKVLAHPCRLLLIIQNKARLLSSGILLYQWMCIALFLHRDKQAQNIAAPCNPPPPTPLCAKRCYQETRHCHSCHSRSSPPMSRPDPCHFSWSLTSRFSPVTAPPSPALPACSWPWTPPPAPSAPHHLQHHTLLQRQ